MGYGPFANCVVCGASFRSLVIAKGHGGGHSKCCSIICARVKAAESRTKHGRSGTPGVYAIWAGMRRRCKWPGDPYFKDYGGRGIKVCERWDSFENFFADMGERPDGLSIERRDINGDYEPGNCCWATNLEQSRNRQNSLKLTIGGVTKCLIDWAAENGLAYATVRYRIRYYGWAPEKAVSTPPRRNGRWPDDYRPTHMGAR